MVPFGSAHEALCALPNRLEYPTSATFQWDLMLNKRNGYVLCMAMIDARFIAAAVLLAAGLSACGGGSAESSPPPVTTHSVALAWEPNRESGVNRAGGGYQVSISGQPTIIVPHTAGPAAPTTTMVSLNTGSYTVTVRAFAALDPQGGNTGSLSAPSQPLTLNVP
jgi:hypothetical protein